VQVVGSRLGFGPAEDETEKYDQLVANEPIQYGDFKLFYSRTREWRKHYSLHSTRYSRTGPRAIYRLR